MAPFRGAVLWHLFRWYKSSWSKKDKVIEDEVILDSISLASILPGLVAFNVVINIGYFLRGIKGALVSMIAILLPSFVFITILSWLYFIFDEH